MTHPVTAPLQSSAIPLQGYGLYKVPPEDAEELTLEAIRAGYRLIDTAAFYQNEGAVGRAVRRAIAEGRVQREDLFITSKLWNDSHGYRQAQRAFQDSLDRLGLDYLDLYLIHWPCPAQDKYLETWRGLEELATAGAVRRIGTSNFLPEHLERLLADADIVPALNQIELHPWLQQTEARKYHARHGIATQAWSPLARGRVLDDPVIVQHAAEQRISPAQLVLCWLRDDGISAIPKASSPPRILENLQLPGTALPTEAKTAIAGLDRGQRVGSDPRQIS
ncbi:aldo/keto reductase [Acaricomes phytoseiuli]|uniref:aldo/keto reductase n=1 Tax=Acaricomes phytoseiuli TaxID=291968 RepID=UPI00037F6DF3|nr:aldo/keto reductase [Acaricomes phytoseiuli]MCW1249155.1 aldo/keto reductase [Acaricomes phytoseiuli]